MHLSFDRLGIQGLLCATLLPVFLACGSSADPVGRWVDYKVGDHGNPVGIGDGEVEFFEDQNCTMSPKSGLRFGCEWVQLSDGRTKIEVEAMGISMIYIGRFDADLGTFQAPDGEELRLVRAGSKEEERIRRRVEGE